MLSPRAEAIAQLKSQVEARLSQSHEQRISELTSRLQASVLPGFDKRVRSEARPATADARAAVAGPMEQIRLAEVFDELLASDQANRMHQLSREVTFREKEVHRLRDALEKAQLEASWSKQKVVSLEGQLSKVNDSTALLESELRKLQQDNLQSFQQIQSLTTAKSAAERAAALAEARAATAEGLLAGKSQELEQLQTHHKRFLADHQAETDGLRKQLQAQSAENSRIQSAAATREQGLVQELQHANSSLVDAKTALAAEKATAELLHTKAVELTTELEAARTAKQQLHAQLQQVEGLLADSETERRSIRAKYMNLGDKLEGMLVEEAAQQKAAAAEVSSLQQQLQQAQQVEATIQEKLQHTAEQLVEAQQALVDMDRLHSKAIKKLDRQMQQLAEDCDVARQELLIKSAEMLDLQGQLKDMQVQQQLQLTAAHDQAESLQNEVAQLQQQLQQAAEREQQVQQEAITAAEERLQLELRQQQLRYEQQIQELELQSRFLTALDALSSTNSLAARQALEQSAPVSACSADPMALRLATESGAGVDSFSSRGRFEAFDARLRRTLVEHINRADTVEALEAKFLAAKKELSADYQRRLDSLETEWASRTAARTAELEGTHALRMQQVELTARLEKDRLEARITEVSTTKLSLEEQLSAAKQETSRLSKEASQARAQMEEARIAQQLLQTQLNEAKNSLRQLQSVVDKYGGSTTGDREIITDLMTRLETRTEERNEALQKAAAAEARLKVLEFDKIPQQRQLQQALDSAEAAKAAAEAKLRAAMAEAAEAAAAAETAQATTSRQTKRLQEEKKKLEDSLEEVEAARSSLERQLSLCQAEARSLASKLKDTSQALNLLQEDYAGQESLVTRLREEKQQLLATNVELESARAQLSSHVAVSTEEQRRLGLMVQGLELSKAGLQRRLSVVEAEKQMVVRTSELRASTVSPTRASIVSGGAPGMDLRTITTLPPSAAAAAAGGSPFRESFAAPSAAGSGGDFSAGSSPRAGGDSFAFLRTSCRAAEAADAAAGTTHGLVHQGNMQDLDGLMAQFDEERRLMLQRYDALDSENSSLRQQLAAATVRASELSLSNEQLLKSLERHKGALGVESKAAQELADKVLSDVQRSSTDMAELNAWLQRELDAARRGHKEALEATSAAESRAIALEVKVSELQRAAATAAREAETKYATQLSKLEVSSNTQISSLKGKLAAMKEDTEVQLAALAKEEAQRVAELTDKHAKELEQQKIQAASAAEVAAQEHNRQVAQLQQLMKDKEEAAAAQISLLQQQLEQTQERMAAVVGKLLMVLQLPQQQQQQQGWVDASVRLKQVPNSTVGSTMLHQQTIPGSPGRSSIPGPASPGTLSSSPGRASAYYIGGFMQQQQLQRQQQQQQQCHGFSSTHVGQQHASQPVVADAVGPLPHEAVELSESLWLSITTGSAEPAAEDVAGALQVLVQGLCQQLQGLGQQLMECQQENDQLMADASSLACDLQMCATNLQSLVATIAFSVTIDEEVQQGLNAKDPNVFDEQLAALHEAIKKHVESEKQQLSAALHAGPVADLQQQLEAAHTALAEATGTIKQMKTERQDELVRFEEGLHRARTEAADGAELARRESLAGLKAELQQMKSQLSQLHDAHSSELTSLQEASAKQLAAHIKSADAIIKELESTAIALQTQLASEVERADAYSKELKRLQTDKEWQIQLEARKERRQTGEIEGLRERLRAMESRDKEKEDEMKQLKKSLRQKELSLLSSTATSLTDR